MIILKTYKIIHLCALIKHNKQTHTHTLQNWSNVFGKFTNTLMSLHETMSLCNNIINVVRT